jgi:hypothetical protein
LKEVTQTVYYEICLNTNFNQVDISDRDSDSDSLIESPDKPLTTLQAHKNKNTTHKIKLQ